jgi:hypothetical protein
MSVGNLAPKVALVHGGGIYEADGNFHLRPGAIARTEHAAGLLENGYIVKMVMSGGNANGLDLGSSEASLMADHAMSLGVPHTRIEREDTSSSTIGNWANSLPILTDMGAERVVGVTSRIASVRAANVGREIIDHYNTPLEISGYCPSSDDEGLRAYPREFVSSQMARRCMAAAWKQGIPAEGLDSFYLGWKSRTGLAVAKAKLTRR